MKKLIILCAMLFVTTYCKADQLAYITKEQAQKATEFLQSHKEIMLWCACCDQNSTKQVVTITKVYFEHTGYEQYYQVVLEGTDVHGNKVTEKLDLAYVHFKIGNNAYNVGKTLGFECDPCTTPFLWTE